MALVCTQDTAVIILSYNGRKWHELFLPQILKDAAAGYEVIIADNASTDDTAAWLKENYPHVRVLSIPVNRGFTGGYVAALQQVEAKYYILLSTDFEVSEGWYGPLYSAMERDPKLAACQPKVRYWKDKAYFEYAGAAGGFMDKWGYMFCRGRIFETLEKDQGQYDDPIGIFWATGGCLMIRAGLYHEMGGLDEDLYAHMEEVDLCWRLKNAGYRIGYVGASTVYHVGGSVISYGSPEKLYYNFRNSLILLLKNERMSRLLWLFPWRLILDGVAALQQLIGGNFKAVATIFKAHMHFYGGLPKWLKHRKEAQKHVVPHRNREGMYPRSIVWDYFAKGRKKFSQLNWKPEEL